jgi:hypothetical protein
MQDDKLAILFNTGASATEPCLLGIERVYLFLKDIAPEGATRIEIQRALNMNAGSVGGRLNQLMTEDRADFPGRVIKLSFRRRSNERPSTVYKLEGIGV